MMNAAGGRPAMATEPELSSPLIDLPREAWGIILKKIGQKDALNLRLVNQDFMDKVNNLYEDWKIELDERSPSLEMILDLRVKEVDVCRLLNTPPFRPPGILFKYPDLIQTLTLDSFTSSSQNTHILLLSKNLKFISLSLRGRIEPFVPLGPLGYNYPDLHTLEICIGTSYEDEEQLLEPGNLFQRMMMSSTMPKLKSFNFSYDCHNNKDTIYDCSSVLLSFLSRQGQNLQHFHYTSWTSQSHSFAGFPPLEDSIVLNNMTSLETLSFEFNCNADPLDKTWRRLIQNQKNLVDLKLGYRFTMSSTFLREIVANNFQTLTSVKIKNWTHEEGQTDKVFDASIFEACHSLTRLEVIPDNWSFSKVVNLFSIPTQIQTLYLQTFGADSEDLLNFLLGHPVLSELGIYSGGNLPILEAVLSHDALLSLRIGRGIELPTSPSDLARLDEIFELLKCRKIQGELIIKRPSAIANWENNPFGYCIVN